MSSLSGGLGEREGESSWRSKERCEAFSWSSSSADLGVEASKRGMFWLIGDGPPEVGERCTTRSSEEEGRSASAISGGRPSPSLKRLKLSLRRPMGFECPFMPSW